MFTIKSESAEGTYYLVKNWEKNMTFWKTRAQLKASDLFKRPQDAKRSLTMLLKVMDEYATDTFTLVEI